MTDIRRIAVVGGGGQMGNGIGQVAAVAGFEVTLLDVDRGATDRGLARIDKSLARLVKRGDLTEDDRDRARARISTGTGLDAAAEADHVIEAIVEDLAAKQETFARLNGICRPEVIFASNTSQFPISAIGRASGRADRVIGTHWFNPPPIMRLIEVVRGLETSDQTLATVLDLADRFGKQTIVCHKDTAGFVTSRLIMALILEAMRLVEEGVADVADINKAAILGFNHAMGPLDTVDLGGLDTFIKASASMTEAYGERFRSPQVVRTLVNAGHYGWKTGRGFSDHGTAE